MTELYFSTVVKHRLTVRVYYEDTDSGGVVYYANYLCFAERARSDLLRSLGCSCSRLLKEKGTSIVVRRCDVDFFKPAFLDDLLQVEIIAIDLKKASLWLTQNISRCSDLLVSMKVLLACIDEHGKPRRIPDDLMEALQKI